MGVPSSRQQLSRVYAVGGLCLRVRFGELSHALETRVLRNKFFDGLIREKNADLLLITAPFGFEDGSNSKSGMAHFHPSSEAGARGSLFVVIWEILRIKIRGVRSAFVSKA